MPEQPVIDFSQMSDEDILANIARNREASNLLRTFKASGKTAPGVDPELKRLHKLRTLAKVAGRNTRQHRQAGERKVISDAEYQAGVEEYLKEHELTDLPKALSAELAEIYTTWNTPKGERQ